MNRNALGAALLAALVFSAPEALAAVVNVGPGQFDLGTVANGQSGAFTFDKFLVNDPVTTTATGTTIFSEQAELVMNGILPADSMITFSYSTPGGLYQPLSSTLNIAGTFTVGSSYGLNAVPGPVFSGTAGPGGVFALSNLQSTTGTGIIENWTSQAIPLRAIYDVWTNGTSPASASFEVSAVPLPSSLSMFLAGLGVLLGFSRLKRQRAEA